MKKKYIILLFILACSVSFAQQLKPIAQKINDRKTQRIIFTPAQLFDISPASSPGNPQLSKTVGEAAILKIRPADIQDILDTKPGNIVFTIPAGQGAGIELELFRSEIFTPDFSVVAAADGRAITYSEGLHYWGIVKGDNASLAAISIFNDEIMGIISSLSKGNLVLGKIKNDPGGKHILYNESDLHAASSMHCHTPDDNISYHKKDLQQPLRISMVNCIRLYWEVNYDIFQDKGSVVNATNYVTGLFNESAIIYTNDNIPVSLSQVFVWDIPSPYTSATTPGLLGQFQAYRNSFNGDLGHLLGYAGGGGIAAGFNGLCAANLDNSQCYSGISSTYNNVPTYSWSVEVVTHEQGHLMGSRHTHACVWNGNNTAIDGCGPAAGYPYEGSCSGATIPTGGGTIMSYCHLVSVGINFSNGFGPQPAAVILNNYNNAACLTSCSGSTCLAPINTSTTNVTGTTAMFNWDAVTGAVSYNIQYRIVGTSTWSTGTSPTNFYNASGLTPGSTYEWQVQTVCSGGTSIFTGSVNFITVPLTCNIPSNLSTINISSVSATFSWSAVPGAVSYSVRYRIIGTGTWTTGTTSSLSYAATGLTPATNYEWQVQTSCAGGGTSAFSNSVNFTTLAIGQAVTIILQPEGDCGKDALIADCINCGYYNTNFGNSMEFDAIAWTNGGNISDARSLLQFDLTEIPAGSAVQSAYLSLYYDSTSSNLGHSQLSGANDAMIYEISLPWDENTVTWANQPATSTANQVYLAPSANATQDYTNIDVTAMIQDFVNDPALNYGMMVQLVTESAYRSLIFRSSDHPNSLSHPKLEVTYAPAISNCLHLKYAGCNGIDAMVSSCIPCGYDTMNSGTAPEIDAIAWTNQGNISNARSLLYWDLTSIPTNATVTSALLSLYTWNSPSNGQHDPLSGPNDAYLNKVTGPWNEYTVTWNTMPGVSTVNQVYFPASTSATQDYTNMDVTTLVQDMVTNPATNYGFMLQLVTEQYYRKLIFASSDHADPAKHPLLEICYTVPVGIMPVQNENHISVIQDFNTGTVTVRSPLDFEPGSSISLFNPAGQLVSKFDNLKGQTFTFTKPGVSRGIYFYQLVNPPEILNGKLIFK
ncbi:MAG TPA: DNRLRE domain-containing protein [Bacteroidia bacterium]|nr:DNRLRE domain-containing protein [Bacteroidia bacterium]